LESLKGLPTHEQKQLLGDRLFPLVKVSEWYKTEKKKTNISIGYWCEAFSKNHYTFIR
jgi:hypothetical protein